MRPKRGNRARRDTLRRLARRLECGIICGIEPPMPRWRNGRRSGLKIHRAQAHAGSSPALGTIAAAPQIMSRRYSRAGAVFFFLPFADSESLMIFASSIGLGKRRPFSRYAM